MVLLILTALPAQATVLTVPDGAIAVDGSDGVCSLREAIENANGNSQIHADCPAGDPGSDTVELAVVGAYVFTDADSVGGSSALPRVTDDLLIHGRGSTLRRSDDAGVPSFRILEVLSAELVLRNLVFENGLVDSSVPGSFLSGGGALLIDEGTLDVRYTDFVDNTTETDRGGAVLARTSEVVLADTRFLANNALVESATSGGGALAVTDGSLTADRCAFVGNRADGAPGNPSLGGSGGAILVEGTVDEGIPYDTVASIFHSTISSNTANSSGGIAVVTQSGPNASVLLDLAYVTLVRNDGEILVDGIGFAGADPQGFVVYTSSVIHSNGHVAPDGSVIGVDCQVTAQNAFLSNFGNLLRDGGECPIDEFADVLTDDLADDLAFDPVIDHHPPVAGGRLVDNAGYGPCTPGVTLDQKGKVRANGPDAGGSVCDIGAIEYYGSSTEELFADSFESGGVGNWSDAAP